MRNLAFEGHVTALSSISHIGETRGVTAELRREKVLLPTGDVEEVPIISGNGLRGPLRDLRSRRVAPFGLEIPSTRRRPMLLSRPRRVACWRY